MPARSATSSWVSRRRSRAFRNPSPKLRSSRRTAGDVVIFVDTMETLDSFCPTHVTWIFQKIAAFRLHLRPRRVCRQAGPAMNCRCRRASAAIPVSSAARQCHRVPVVEDFLIEARRMPGVSETVRRTGPALLRRMARGSAAVRTGGTAASQGGLRNAGGLCGTAEACWVSECV